MLLLFTHASCKWHHDTNKMPLFTELLLYAQIMTFVSFSPTLLEAWDPSGGDAKQTYTSWKENQGHIAHV